MVSTSIHAEQAEPLADHGGDRKSGDQGSATTLNSRRDAAIVPTWAVPAYAHDVRCRGVG
jgi:hypothetical protein